MNTDPTNQAAGHWLAQENLPLPGEGTLQDGSVAPVPGQPAAGGDAGPFGGSFFLIMGLMFLGVMAISLWGQRRDRKQRDAMLGALGKHDKVQTTGGVVGSIVDVRKDLVVLKVDESNNTRITFARSAIQTVLESNSASGSVSVKEEKG